MIMISLSNLIDVRPWGMTCWCPSMHLTFVADVVTNKQTLNLMARSQHKYGKEYYSAQVIVLHLNY